jgi:hypothetical protein
MSLMLALAIVGALALAAVVAHGMWTARKADIKRAESPLTAPSERRDNAERVEPALDQPVLLEDEVSAAAAPRALRQRASARLDALIDAIAPLTLEAPVSAELALTHLPTTRRAGSKPFMIEGLNTESGEWEPPTLGERYGEFQAGLQLANRAGALNEIEYSEFVQKVQAFAEPVGAMADFPDMLDVVARARELDVYASQHDAQLVVHLQARGAAWSVGYIQQQAARHGFVPGVVAGRLVLPAATEGAPPVLTLGFDAQAALADDPNLAAVRDVTLSFDVPQTDKNAQPFAAWQASAQALARDMDAAIVDDNGQPLDDAGFAHIGGQLGQLYDALQARDLAAGSAAARRLFS